MEKDSLKGTSLEITHINLLDGTVEGCECIEDKVISVQFHPESAPAAGFNLPFRQIHKHDSSSQQIILPLIINVLNVFKVFRVFKVFNDSNPNSITITKKKRCQSVKI